MPRQVLSSEFLATLSGRVPASKTVSYFDTEIKGFLLEHRASGGATYYFRYRNTSRKVQMNRIGRRDTISLSDARAKAHEMKKMLTEGGDPKVENHRFKDVPTFGEFVSERYLPYAMARKRSWKKDEILLRLHLLPAFGKFRLNRITRSDVVAMHHATKEKGYAAGTCNQILILAKLVFNCALRWDFLLTKGNPCAGVKPFEDNGARERYLTEEEVGRLFDELDRHPKVQVAQVIRLLLFTGARMREILDAKWEHIDFNRRILTVPLSKSGKPRYIPLSDAAMEILQSLPRDPEIPWVFYSQKTKRPLWSVFYTWRAIRTKLGLGDVRLHDLRHSFASFLVSSGRSLYEVQKLLGHHDPKMTMRYAHLSPGALIDAANIVGNLVGKRPGAIAIAL